MTYQRIYNNEFLAGKRLIGDTAADIFIKQVFKDTASKKKLQLWLSGPSGSKDLNLLGNIFPQIFFISNAQYLPDWADPRLMKAGSDFFARHSTAIMSLLGLLSLPYCYTAANGARVLYLSERMRNDTTQRLYNTATFVWEIMAPGAFETNGKAFSVIMKVRLMHSAVRYYTIQSGEWDDSWGVPINQEDMAGTNLSFSLIVIRGLRLLGFTVSQADQSAFMHLWNVIGYLSGLQEDLISSSTKMAQMLDTAISKRQFHGSQHGKELAKSLTDHIITINKGKATATDIMGLMRYLLGKEVAEMLAIDAPELSSYKIGLIRTLNVLKSFIPPGDVDFLYRRAYSAFKSQKPA